MDPHDGHTSLCTGCGAPLRLSSLNHEHVSFRCDFCGLASTVDAREFAHLNEAQRAARALRAAETRLDEHTQMWVRYGRRMTLSALLSIAVISPSMAVLALQEDDRPLLHRLLPLFVNPVFLFAIAALVQAFYLQIVTIPRAIREVGAAPPLAPGEPMRCRGCGAALPGPEGAFVDCAHCDVQNLLCSRRARDVTARLRGRAEAADQVKTNRQAWLTQALQRSSDKARLWPIYFYVVVIVLAAVLATLRTP